MIYYISERETLFRKEYQPLGVLLQWFSDTPGMPRIIIPSEISLTGAISPHAKLWGSAKGGGGRKVVPVVDMCRWVVSERMNFQANHC